MTAVAARAEHQHALQQQARAVQQSMQSTVEGVQQDTLARHEEEERRFVMPELRAFRGGRR